MKAVILAAGKGKRLHSEETKLPKCMVRANGRPLLDYVLVIHRLSRGRIRSSSSAFTKR